MQPSRSGLTSPLIALTRPPAKLNLFLELLRRREDGYHEIDTIMVPIDWSDTLRLRRIERCGINLSVNWSPSIEIVAARLGIDAKSEPDRFDQVLAIPTDGRNLVHQALGRFLDHFDVSGGFQCELVKSIPAGAGMGGASSDAAAALRCAAQLHGIPLNHPDLSRLASDLGSDVPFFLGIDGQSCLAARATGRGEKVAPIGFSSQIDVVVVFPAISLSTARVYSQATVPSDIETPDRLIDALQGGKLEGIAGGILNRLQGPALKIASQIEEILESMWRCGLIGCQLTGSGSACFGFVPSRVDSVRAAEWLRSQLEPGAIVTSARSVPVPSLIELHQSASH
ncbi:4-(cytidine 5'-diphospho)-2-C-methyl-D-erythritol kinase [Novipirellula artificiosorum]|uniref:4-diphosphocytidyl-2-C-methyl-D-erythritol kinase n=1 Tax=Novipirellula artificiosorum TaxID=2528016 RepID=A0A5C6DBB7_9BACT|nr:4-(cytidine 5'-diphospho)-2-C-methyl-D-erythritol kinase [Novipirellula artificiosorum]TWU34473.1 4-diphosphocytidyl-2-C-methyl-D-erythritol kinase [Novipirellula artificiosorum]